MLEWATRETLAQSLKERGSHFQLAHTVAGPLTPITGVGHHRCATAPSVPDSYFGFSDSCQTSVCVFSSIWQRAPQLPQVTHSTRSEAKRTYAGFSSLSWPPVCVCGYPLILLSFPPYLHLPFLSFLLGLQSPAPDSRTTALERRLS